MRRRHCPGCCPGCRTASGRSWPTTVPPTARRTSLPVMARWSSRRRSAASAPPVMPAWARPPARSCASWTPTARWIRPSCPQWSRRCPQEPAWCSAGGGLPPRAPGRPMPGSATRSWPGRSTGGPGRGCATSARCARPGAPTCSRSNWPIAGSAIRWRWCCAPHTAAGRSPRSTSPIIRAPADPKSPAPSAARCARYATCAECWPRRHADHHMMTIDMNADIIVIAKTPVAGRVKTPLTPAYSPAEAAMLAEAALRDTLAAVMGTPAGRRILALAGAPGPWLPDGVVVVAQRGDGLDERLAHAFDDAYAGRPLILIGMDTPQVTSGLLTTAGAALRSHDAVFGPAADGGFWLLGLLRPDPALLLGVPMSHPDTGRVQLDRLNQAGLTVAILPTLTDVDTPCTAAEVAGAAPHSRFAA